MHAQVAGDGRRARPGPAAAGRRRAPRRAATCSPGWPTTTSPSSATASTASRPRRATPTSAAARRARHRARHPARRPGPVELVRQAAAAGRRPRRARRRCWCWPRPTPARPCTARPTSTTSASRRSTRTARSSASAASSACSRARPTPSRVTRIPVLREKVAEVMRHAGFDPRSHAGKALMDILETYPRDELFHTPRRRARPDRRGRDVRPRAAPAAAVRAPRHLRPLRLRAWSTCPRDRYNTAVRERFADDPAASDLGGEPSSSPPASTSRRPRACTSSSTRPRASHIPEIDIAELERRLAEASRSWRDDFAAAVVERVRRGAVGRGSARRYADAFPEAYKEDYPPAARRRRPRPARGDRGRRGHRPRALDQDQQSARRRGEARLKVFRIGAPLSLSHVLPMLSSMGVEVVDERPYELDGPGPAVLHLRVRPALRPGAARRTRATLFPRRCARSGTATTRSTASTRWSSPPG